ncbi:MAG TPA: hypothetical protein VH062_33905 [Polyangiaceae bacterium]|nr:hypothetical protein [Polyangiaceae bacterium]
MPNHLVIDASLAKRLAAELRGRGRDATALSQLGLHKLEDPEMLRAVAERFGATPWILATGDDDMPAEHADVLAELRATVATVDPRWPSAPIDAQERWKGKRCIAGRIG